MVPRANVRSPVQNARVLDRYLQRIGLDGAGGDPSVAALQRSHVERIPYENLDIHLGREIHLDVDHLVEKMVDRRRGGYCFEQNTLFAAVLESLGHTVTRCLGRVRLSDQVNPRPATHMTLLVDGCVVDVGFGSANPLGPVPLGGDATYGPYTWRTTRTVTPEGEEGWLLSLSDIALYTFTEAPQHPIDYVAPNHFASTHPRSLFTQVAMAQRWTDDDVQVGLVGLQLRERLPAGGEVRTTEVPGDELGAVLHDRFGLTLGDDELARLRRFVGG